MPSPPKVIYVTPPSQILRCKNQPEKPDRGTATSESAAIYITKLHSSWQDCSDKLSDVKKFIGENQSK